ncbi:hypothetical protein ACU686_31230 [Yinghuangia aomiensis]
MNAAEELRHKRHVGVRRAWVAGARRCVRSRRRSTAATRSPAGRGAVRWDVYKQAGITDPRRDIDVAELRVPFSWYEPMWLEGRRHRAGRRGLGRWSTAARPRSTARSR